jgi:hypothetical protein
MAKCMFFAVENSVSGSKPLQIIVFSLQGTNVETHFNRDSMNLMCCSMVYPIGKLAAH